MGGTFAAASKQPKENMGDKVRPEDIDCVIAELPEELREQFGEEFEENVMEMFDSNDKDASGELDVNELLPGLTALWSSFGCTAPCPTIEDCKEVVDQFDADSNGKIGKREFVCFCKVLFLTAMAQ